VALALLGAAAMILAWAIPAGLSGGAEYRNAIFWGQTANRMVSSFAHRAPWWAYLAWLPLMLAPWLLWPRWWRGLRRELLAESGFRFALGGALFCLVFFSLVSGKRPHYLLPEFVLFALLAARALCDSRSGRWSTALPAIGFVGLGLGAIGAAPRLAKAFEGAGDVSVLYGPAAFSVVAGLWLSWRISPDATVEVRRIATAALAVFCGFLVAFDLGMREPYDLTTVGAKLALFEREGRPLAFEGDYHGQWTFAGRLQRPLEEVPEAQAAVWLAAHPQGRIVVVYRDRAEIPAGAVVEHSRRYRGAWLAVLAAP
jgi:4-amino-4-deoxy-L-arabinose transferase-like glycosyltransferase